MYRQIFLPVWLQVVVSLKMLMFLVRRTWDMKEFLSS